MIGCFFMLVSGAFAGSSSKPPDSAQIDAIFSAAIGSGEVPGAAVLVIKNGEPVFTKGYGVAELRSLKKIDSHTNFRLASLTKQFTAMSIMLLVHDGRLHYDDPLAGIFPDFPAYGKAITVRHLLNHTSGLLDYEDLMPAADPKLPVEQVQISDAGVLDLLKHQARTKFAPGSKWDYSNSGYVTLGLIVEKIAGKSFPDFLRERIFAPLEMNATMAYVRGRNTISNRAFGHSNRNGQWEQTDQSPTSATLGDGGIYTSLDDMAKWDRAIRRHTLLSEQEMQAAFTPVKVPGVIEPDGKPASYGFGWFLNPYRGHQRMWHYGETVGFRSTIQRFPADELTIIVLCNRADLNPSALALKVADLFISQTPKPK
jgi:CubicO group peptidase (beta-lactamase class C family)